MPDLYILTGSNGAGKSTTGQFYLPKNISNNYEIFDGDKLSMQKHKQIYKIETPSSKEAKRRATEWMYEEFERRVSKAIKNKDHFVYEGHFPEEENWSTPKRFKSAGYKIHMIFLGLSHPKISEFRVFERAKIGGHNVPPYEIERNFFGNLKQLNIHYQFIDELQIIDTSDRDSRVLAIFINGKVIDALPIKQLPDWFEKELLNLFHLVLFKKNPLDFEDTE